MGMAAITADSVLPGACFSINAPLCELVLSSDASFLHANAENYSCKTGQAQPWSFLQSQPTQP